MRSMVSAALRAECRCRRPRTGAEATSVLPRATAIILVALLGIAGCGQRVAPPAATSGPVPATKAEATSAPTATAAPPPPTTEPASPLPTGTPATVAISAGTVARVEVLAILTGHRDKVYSLAFSGDGATLASASPDKTIRLWETGSRQEIRALAITEVVMDDIAFSPDGRLLASTGTVWDVDSGVEVQRLHPGRAGCVAFSPDGALLAVALEAQPIELWDVAGGRVVRTLDRQADDPTLSIDFSSDGAYVAASGHLDGLVWLWDVERGQVVRTMSHGTRSNLHSVVFSPDGRLLASGSTDGTVRLWDVASGAQVRSLRHGGGVYSAAFSPDGSLLASAGTDRSVKLWDTASGELLRSLRHGDEVMAVVFAPDGTLLASGGYDNQVYLWGVSP